MVLVVEQLRDRTLTQEQNNELHEWRANNPNIPKVGAMKPREKASKKPKSFMKKQVASVVEAELKRTAKSEAQENNEEQYLCLWLKQQSPRPLINKINKISCQT